MQKNKIIEQANTDVLLSVLCYQLFAAQGLPELEKDSVNIVTFNGCISFEFIQSPQEPV